ncbi:MAG: glycosyltransferase [Thermodesulfobacteriota bacterium]
MRKTAIIVPCYNEAERLDSAAFLEAAGRSGDLSFIFVDDGSTDSTLEKLELLKSADPEHIQVLSLERNSGKAEAVRRGFLRALDTDFVNIGYWDADLATPLAAIFKFCDILDTTDSRLVMGSRVRLLGRRIKRKFFRHYLGRLFATFASLVLRIPVYDTQCGAKVFKKSDSLYSAFAAPFKVKWTFDVELLARLLTVERAGRDAHPEEFWLEYPLEEWADIKGSKTRAGDFVRGGFELLKIFSLLHCPLLKGRYSALLTEKKR